MPDLPQTLLLTLAPLLIFGLGWCIVGLLVLEERAAAWMFVAFSLVQIVSLSWSSLVIQQHGAPDVVALLLSSLIGLVANLGSDLLTHHRYRWLRLWLGIFAISALVDLGALALDHPVVVLVLNDQITLLVQMVAALVLLPAPLKKEFGRYGLLALTPFAVFALYELGLTVRMGIDPQFMAESIAADGSADASNMLPFLLATGGFHLAWFGLTVARLVSAAQRMARYDRLTGVLQRAAFEAELERAVALSRRSGKPFGVAFLDLDHFKTINDRGGHRAGDVVLRGFAELLRNAVRAGDLIGRWGGEEFVLLMPASDRAATRALLERLQTTLRSSGLPVPPGCTSLSVSIGFTAWAGEADDGDSLVHRADAAMYQAKADGRDRIVEASIDASVDAPATPA